MRSQISSDRESPAMPCGHLLYQATRDPKVVQETLRHSSITTAGQYSHTEERSKAMHTRVIPVKME